MSARIAIIISGVVLLASGSGRARNDAEEKANPSISHVFAFTLCNGYGEGERFPEDSAVFENLDTA